MNSTLAKLLSNSDFDNYIKSLVGLNITRNVILPVVFDRIKGFQDKCLADICEKNNLPPGTICTKCPTKKIIASSLSDKSDNESGCQYKICNLFKNEIEENHRYNKPSYLNSDAKLWCSNPWELAKCFMPQDGYKHITCKEETDFNGVINVVINHKMFPNDEIFQQVREISNKIRHNPNLQISNEDFQKNLEILNNILAHKEFFDRAKDGRENLEQLRVISVVKCEEKDTEQSDIDLADKLATELNSLLRPEQLTMLKEKIENYLEEENEEKHEMPNLCSSNGKLIKLNDCQLKGILQNCEKSPVVGGFGIVHISKTKVPGLDIRVIVKEIICEDTELTKISTTFNEKISRRVMHFAIVPLIGFINQEVVKKNNIQRITKRYYFLSPYLENGSLRLCLERDASEEDIKMKHRRRIEILFQVASAIHYLHSPVKGYRGIVLHMDITSSNIVLDEHFNARLIDFGLAREMNEYQTKVTLTQSKPHGTPGYTRSKTSTSKKYLTVYDDYYNFGVVIREILTGKQPYIKTNGDPDQLKHHGEGTITNSLQKNVWYDSEDGNGKKMEKPDKEMQRKIDKLLSLSTQCLLKDRLLTSAAILKDLKEIRVKEDFIRKPREKCEICMTNPCVKNNRGLSTHNCCGEKCCVAINVCLSCMRNSHLNPIVCPTCGEIVIPEIGHTYAAVLIAGYHIDQYNKQPLVEVQKCTQSFIDDVKAIKTVLASKYPCVIGISEERIKVVTPESPEQKEDLLPKIAAAFESLHESQDIRTLLFYYTGHFSSKTGFQLDGNKSVLNLTDLQAHFERFCEERKETKRIIAFLDCCQAPDIKNEILLEGKQVQTCQLNVCRQNEVAYQYRKGSLFRMLFVQALTRKFFNKDCFIHSDPCKDCEMSGEFISIAKMLEYISEHIESKYKNSKPAVYLPKEITFGETCFGYNIDFAAEFEFKFRNKNFEEEGKIEIEQGIYCDIDKLKSSIHHALCEKNDETLMFPSNKFLDTLSLQIYNGQKHGEELQSMVQVSAAMDNQQCVVVSVRPVSRILNGRVVLFPPQTEFIEYLKKNGLLTESTEPRRDAPATVTLSKTQLNDISKDIKKDDVLKTMSSDIDEVFKNWDNVNTTGVKELKITFPEKDNGSHEFILLELIRES